MSEKMIDARGLSCPEPVLLVKQALKEDAAGAFTVAVNSATARDNVTALLEGAGRAVAAAASEDGWLLAVAAK